MNILITGANGFIGRALCSRLASGNKVMGVDITGLADGGFNIVREEADLTDCDSVTEICEKHSPDVVIHCAGIAHQKMGAVDSAAYMRVNSEVTERLARAAAKFNPDVCFIFLSSVSVYGEDPQITQITRNNSRKKAQETHNIRKSGIRSQESGDGTTEDGECWPSSDYAVSKLDAERRLLALYDEGKLQNLVILRLAPVYDCDWSLNLDRRVFAPGKVAYLRFGSGMQRMSALARPNLVEFIEFISRKKAQNTQEFREQKELVTPVQSTDYADFRRLKDISRKDAEAQRGKEYPQVSVDENNMSNRCNLRINVCDAEAYEFNRIIEVFKKSGIRPRRPVISVPLSVVWVATRIAGCLLRNKREWIHSCYDKLACDLVFDNGRMMGMGFRARHSLETILAADERR